MTAEGRDVLRGREQVADASSGQSIGEGESATHNEVGIAGNQIRHGLVVSRVQVLDIGLIDPEERVRELLKERLDLLPRQHELPAGVVGVGYVDQTVLSSEDLADGVRTQPEALLPGHRDEVGLETQPSRLQGDLEVGEARGDNGVAVLADQVPEDANGEALIGCE